MKIKNLLETVLFISAFVMMNQFANAQCAAGKVWACRIDHQCQQECKCVKLENVSNWASHGKDPCRCYPCQRANNQSNALANALEVYPNPVSNSTTISFFLLQSQNVSFSIFDVGGRLVSILADKVFEAGKNEIVWNARNVNPGVYFLQYRSTGNLRTEKLIISK